MAVMAGVFVGLAHKTAFTALVAASVLLAALLLPLRGVFVLMLVVLYLIVGPTQYFGGFSKVFWVPYLLGLVVLLRLGMTMLVASAERRAPNRQAPVPGSSVVLFYVLFLVVAAASSLLNTTDPLLFLTAGKEYFWLAGVPLAFGLGVVGLTHVDRVVRWIPWFLFIQLPVAAYQRFAIAAGRSGLSPWDAVVGLFPGDPLSGGASGTMGLFTVLALILLIEGWKAGKIKASRVVLAAVAGIGACALAEVKLVLVLIPLIGFVQFGASVWRRPVQSLVLAMLAVAVSGALLILYQRQFTSAGTPQGQTIIAYVETTIDRNAQNPRFDTGFRQMGRVAAVSLWWQAQRRETIAHTLLGYGVGATRVGQFAVGELVLRYQRPIGRSSLVIYLWETGVIGVGLVTALLISVGIAARRLARAPAIAEHAWLLRGTVLCSLVLCISLPYGADFLEVAQLQVTALILMGLVLAARRRLLGQPLARG
jgi:hypothetical protein